MASQAKEMPLGNPEDTEIWLQIFEATVKYKKITDTENEHNISNYFISVAGIEAIRKVKMMCRPREINSMKFDEIKTQILTNIQPQKRIIPAERAQFMQTRQEKNEPIQGYVHRLRDKAKFCEFDKLNSRESKQSAEDELLQMRLIDGLASTEHKQKVLQLIQTQTTALTLNNCIDFIQQLELIDKFNAPETINTSKQTGDTIDINYQQKSSNMIMSCKFCGGKHEFRKCPAFGKKCTKCSKLNHFAKVCRSRANNAHFVTEKWEENTDNKNTENNNPNNIWYVSQNPQINNMNIKMEEISVDNEQIKMQIDTGADISVISTKIWKKMGSPKLQRFSKKLEVYDGHVLTTKGKLTSVIERKGKYKTGDIVVVESEKSFGLLGRNFLDNDAEVVINQCELIKSDILPTIKGVKATMELIDNAKPQFCRARPVPLALEAKVDKELTRLESLGIITPITGGVENCSPVVWVRKANDEVRCCADFKVHVNEKIKTDSYPLPRIETIFSKLKNAKVFAKIDLRSAYWQIELDDKAKELSIINTSKGLYRMNRLTMGMKNSASIFQRVMESILSDIKGVLIYQDDVAIYAENKEALEKRLKAVKTRLAEKRITINESKSVEYCEILTFLGFKISARGIEPDDKLVSKIKDIKVPQTCKEIEQFLGLINYFGRLIPNFSNKVQPLNQLRNAKDFQWTIECSQAFESLKDEISSYPVLQPYNLDKEVTLTTDSSKYALGASLTQEGHPVIYVSRCLTKAEQNYSNIEREALAVTWAVMRLKQFLMGRKFTIATDHQPLIKLFGKYPIPTGTSARICKWALDLMSFDYEITYVPGKQILHADALSRMQYNNNNEEIFVDSAIETTINAVYFEKKILELQEVQHELQFDKIGQNIIQRVISGKWQNCTEAEIPFKKVSHLLTIDNNVLYQGTRLYIPPRLRQKAFNITHSERHSGIQSSIRRIQLSAWWPGMSQDVERMTKQCETCNKIRPICARTCDTWPEANPFDRIHMDWAHVKGAGNVLIIVDAATGWIEAFQTNDRDTNTVIKCLRTVFTRFGIPKLVVSDNAMEFTSKELNVWLHNQGAEKRESPPYYPRANGLAERSVQTVKCALKAWTEIKTHQDFPSFLQRILFHHRISAHSRGKSPSELMFNRQIRIPIVTTMQQGQPIWYKPKDSTSYAATYLMTKGNNTSWILNGEELTLASNNQISSATIKQEPDIMDKINKEPIYIDDESEEIIQQSNQNEKVPEISELSKTSHNTHPIISHRRSSRERKKPNRFGFNT